MARTLSPNVVTLPPSNEHTVGIAGQRSTEVGLELSRDERDCAGTADLQFMHGRAGEAGRWVKKVVST
jgi:hypothetical protein